MDPHKRSATIEVVDKRERVLGQGRYLTDTAGYKQMLAAGRKWPQRRWAVEGANGIGKHLAQRLIAVVALRTPALRVVTVDSEHVALRLLADRRDELGTRRTETVNRVHRLLLELMPGGAKTFRTRRALAAEMIEDLSLLDKKIQAANKDLTTLVTASGSHLMDLQGIGPSTAARLIGDVGDIARFPTKGHFASWNGTAPIDASSGENSRHRLSRSGNRRLIRVLHIMAIVQLRNDTEGRRYDDRKKADGKTSMEAMRCLKQRLSDIVFRTMLDDTVAALGTGPGGHRGATLQSSAAGSHPHTDTSDQSLPGPASTEPRTTLPAAS